MTFNLDTTLADTNSITPYYLKKFQKLGIKTIEELILYFPRRYNDFTNLTPIANLSIGQVATIQGKILKIKSVSIFRRRITPLLFKKRSGVNITEAIVEDDSGSIKAIWFNQPYLAKVLAEGTAVSLSGKIEHYRKGIQISNPMYEKMDELGDLTHTGRLVPVYSETAGLTSRYIRNLMKKFLPIGKMIPDRLPALIIEKYKFPSFYSALKEIHFPESKESMEISRQRLAFEELFIIQLAGIKQKMAWRRQPAVSIGFNKELVKNFVGGLPFKLTNDQRKAAWDILRDMEHEYPMNRLLLGDVGSGKTVVAFIAALETASKGSQAAFMAPTEILASQHFTNAIKMLGSKNLTIGLFTGSMAKIYSGSARAPQDISHSAMIGKINSGQAEILFGTHSLIQKDVHFKKLALAVIDEQHRFGARQRGQLIPALKNQEEKEVSLLKPDNPDFFVPHVLSMSATPIPRTLALAFYGTMDISVMNEMPLDRKKIITKIVAPFNRPRAYDFINKQIQKGRQAFIVCPRVDGSDIDQSKAAVKEFDKLIKNEFKGLSMGLLHGRLKPEIKERAIKDFAAGKINILVCTSVVEVGIDAPNASVMMIEGADHFGLAELHQFRGRVGRGASQSYCFLFSDSENEETLERLSAMERSSNGFDLAAQDLRQRGPGEFLGNGPIQSGFPDLKIADFLNEKMLKISQAEAKNILAEDPSLKKYPMLREKLEEYKAKAAKE